MQHLLPDKQESTLRKPGNNRVHVYMGLQGNLRYVDGDAEDRWAAIPTATVFDHSNL